MIQRLRLHCCSFWYSVFPWHDFGSRWYRVQDYIALNVHVDVEGEEGGNGREAFVRVHVYVEAHGTVLSSEDWDFHWEEEEDSHWEVVYGVDVGVDVAWVQVVVFGHHDYDSHSYHRGTLAVVGVDPVSEDRVQVDTDN